MTSTKLKSLTNASKRLNEANVKFKNEKDNTFYHDALIQRFEFTFELSWKYLKELLIDEGVSDHDCSSPKKVLSQAFAAFLIDDESIWVKMLEDRNKTSHLNDEAFAEEICHRISNSYCKEFNKLIKGQ